MRLGGDLTAQSFTMQRCSKQELLCCSHTADRLSKRAGVYPSTASILVLSKMSLLLVLLVVVVILNSEEKAQSHSRQRTPGPVTGTCLAIAGLGQGFVCVCRSSVTRHVGRFSSETPPYASSHHATPSDQGPCCRETYKADRVRALSNNNNATSDQNLDHGDKRLRLSHRHQIRLSAYAAARSPRGECKP